MWKETKWKKCHVKYAPARTPKKFEKCLVHVRTKQTKKKKLHSKLLLRNQRSGQAASWCSLASRRVDHALEDMMHGLQPVSLPAAARPSCQVRPPARRVRCCGRCPSSARARPVGFVSRAVLLADQTIRPCSRPQTTN